MKILESDLFLISKLAFKQNREIFVLDPGKECISNVSCGFHYVRHRKEVEALAINPRTYYIINISGANTFSFPLDFSKVEGIISFNRNIETSLDYYHSTLFYKTNGIGR
ncbi:hypothetical protein ACFLRI_05590, partial [Bacteroidota bacterium]